ncbi:MAG: hypothetical protein IT454_04390 [Planctomycetes bacterium]|nr:hypothetical protein [Planctomycetota bacterium]
MTTNIGLALVLVALSTGLRDSRSDAALELDGVASTQLAAQPAPRQLVDMPRSAQSIALLALAQRAAGALPADPHLKTKARLQELVARTNLELGRMRAAHECIQSIGDWRRGAALAELAAQLAEQGWSSADVRPYVEGARGVLESWSGAGAQDWHQERIRAELARAHLLLGERDAAAQLSVGISDAQMEQLVELYARDLQQDELARRLQITDSIAVGGGFDAVRNELSFLAQLHRRFYADREHREALEAKIKASWSKLPMPLRIELLFELARNALSKGDNEEALSLTDDARGLIDAAGWSVDFQVPFAARLAALVVQSGATERGFAMLAAARDAYDEGRAEILDIDRADVLLPLAESYAESGASDEALAIYGRALREGRVNPNARPRAEDLTALCCSLARHDLGVSEDLWSELNAMFEGLAAPW